jgi:hypothetical protein
MHPHHDQKSQDGDNENSFQEQFEIHGAFLLVGEP